MVYAGENQFVSPVSSKIGLYGVVSDGTLPPSGPLTNVWSELSGPDNNITFYPEETVVDTNFAFADAGATVDMPGTYQFQLIASDAQRRATNVVTVIVDDASVAPPTVSILSPTNNAAFPFGVIPITATANASTGAIAAVDFYAENSDTGDDLLIGRAINHPYIMDWINPPMGNYFLTAVAIDGAGRIESSEPIQIQINYGIYAGAGQVITNSTPNIGTNSLELQGVVSGVGSNALNGAYTTTWSVVSAPANASGIVFSNANLTNTIATFTGKISSLGTYVLMLTLTTDDGSFAICSDVTNTIVAEDVLPYQAPSYFYAYATNDSFAGFQATNYNDSYWNLGPAAFGNGGGCNLTPVTYWPGYNAGNPWLYVRQPFIVPPGATNLSLGLTVANAAQIFINGTLLTPTNTTFGGSSVTQNVAQALYNANAGFSTHYFATNIDHTVTALTNVFFLSYGNCNAYDDLLLNRLSTNLWHTGTNILAVKAFNQGGLSFYDNRISIISSVSP